MVQRELDRLVTLYERLKPVITQKREMERVLLVSTGSLGCLLSNNLQCHFNNMTHGSPKFPNIRTCVGNYRLSEVV